jgi:hypothetical protein
MASQPTVAWCLKVWLDPAARNIVQNQLNIPIVDGAGAKQGSYLAHPLFTSDLEPADVRLIAEAQLNHINGSIVLRGPYLPLLASEETVCELTADGALGACNYYLKADSGRILIESPTAGERSVSQRAYDLMERDDRFWTAATILSFAGQDFRMLYLIFELARNAVSQASSNKSRWAALKAKRWIEPSQFERFRKVAQSHRHAEHESNEHMDGDEGRTLAWQLLRGWLNWKMPN